MGRIKDQGPVGPGIGASEGLAWHGRVGPRLGARSPCRNENVVPSSDQMTFYRIFVVRITSPDLCFYATITPLSGSSEYTVRGLRHARHPQFRSRGTLVATGSPDRTPRSFALRCDTLILYDDDYRLR